MMAGTKLAAGGGTAGAVGWTTAVETVTGLGGDTGPAALQEPMHWQVCEWPDSEGLESWCW